MLKKAGIITAATAAAIVAMSPLAFAGDDHGHYVDPGNQNSAGAVNGLNGNNVDVPVQACNIDAQGGLVPFQDIDPNVPVDVTGLLGEKGESPQTSTGDTRACGADTDTGYGN